MWGQADTHTSVSCRTHFQFAVFSSFGIRLKGNASSAFAFNGNQSLETWNYLSSLKWEWRCWWWWRWRWSCSGTGSSPPWWGRKLPKKKEKEQKWNGHWQLTPPIIHLEQRQKFDRQMKFSLSSAFVLFAIPRGSLCCWNVTILVWISEYLVAFSPLFVLCIWPVLITRAETFQFSAWLKPSCSANYREGPETNRELWS